MIADLVIGWAQNHQQYIAGLASGYALAHIPQMVLLAFNLAMKIPWLRSQVVNNPKQAKAIVDAIAKELDKDIDEEAAKDAIITAPKEPAK